MATQIHDINAVARSIREFWISVRTAAKMMSPKVLVDSPKLDANEIARILDQADLWLCTSSVEGFEQADLDFLSDEERVKLCDCVEKFRMVADKVLPTGPATSKQVSEARPQFQGILEIVRPDKYGDPESFVVGKLLEQRLDGRFPDWVKDLRIESGFDSTGDSAIWIWVEIADEAANNRDLLKNYTSVQELLRRELKSIGEARWPYIRIRTVSEQSA